MKYKYYKVLFLFRKQRRFKSYKFLHAELPRMHIFLQRPVSSRFFSQVKTTCSSFPIYFCLLVYFLFSYYFFPFREMVFLKNLGPPSYKDVCFYLTVIPQVDCPVKLRRVNQQLVSVFKIKLILDKSCFFFFLRSQSLTTSLIPSLFE